MKTLAIVLVLLIVFGTLGMVYAYIAYGVLSFLWRVLSEIRRDLSVAANPVRNSGKRQQRY